MPKNKFHTSTLIITIICLILVASYYLGLSSFVPRYITTLTNPIISRANYFTTSLSDFISLYLNVSYLNRDNKKLRRQLIELTKKNVTLKLLEQENQWLKNELEFLDDYQYSYVISRVLGQDLNYSKSQIIIDKGLSAGIKPGLAVTTSQGIIIGQISQVEANLSHVELLIDNQSKLAVLIVGEHPSLGIARGQHNLNLKVEMLSKEIEIRLDDLVTTASLNPDIPVGLLIGRVSKIENKQEKLWQEALVEPAVNYQTVRLVTVILPEE